MPRVILMYDGDRPALRERAEALRPTIEQVLPIAAIESNLEPPFEPRDAEIAIALGGDGTVLRSARLMGHDQLPLVGVNLGKLGFLAGINPEDLGTALPEIAARRFRLVDHLMIACSHVRSGKVLSTRLGLNEAAILAGEPFTMIEVDLRVDGDLAATYSSDGMLISTPVGSTAHNLATGGPILRKDLHALVVSAINPHTLTVRPVVDSADRVYELNVPQPNPGTRLMVDGQVVGALEPGDTVRVEKSPAVFQTVEVAGQTYYRTLRGKLGWGRRPRDRR
ncbi:NAD(+)/NADH kinase [Botrimarina hoheduenensis]|uniref:NAD(+)/NADH kinase n=1 Tax=Botrimarina hoheduenensis TaxID=2528000 RepID=UPI0018D2CB65|nr:NAD(+)/NADH kinase [Botrimarina hoheduenensis]